MTLPADHPILESVAEILGEYDFAVAIRAFEGLDEPILVVESRDVVAVVLASDHWRRVADTVDAAQISLANWVSRHDESSRRWDLYVVVLLEQWPDTPQEGADIERAEANTEIARKVIRSGISTTDRDRVRDALRALLPLEPVGRSALPDIAAALQERLRVHGIDAETAERAVSGFIQGGRVWI